MSVDSSSESFRRYFRYSGSGIIVLLFLVFALPHEAFAAEADEFRRMTGLVFIGLMLLVGVSTLIATERYLNPILNFRFDTGWSDKINLIERHEKSPHWYWVMNIKLVALSFAVIFAGFVLERQIYTDASQRAPGELPHLQLIEGMPLTPYIVIYIAMVALWMPMVRCIRDALEILLITGVNPDTIVTQNGLKVLLPPETLDDADELHKYLRSYRGHPDFDELCTSALRRAQDAHGGLKRAANE